MKAGLAVSLFFLLALILLSLVFKLQVPELFWIIGFVSVMVFAIIPIFQREKWAATGAAAKTSKMTGMTGKDRFLLIGVNLITLVTIGYASIMLGALSFMAGPGALVILGILFTYNLLLLTSAIRSQLHGSFKEAIRPVGGWVGFVVLCLFGTYLLIHSITSSILLHMAPFPQ